MKIRIPPALRTLAAAPHQPGAPKYELLSAAMTSAVATGEWGPGERLPTEAALAQALPFSLGTVQRALRKLVDEGLVVRRQRSGTFVAPPRQALEGPWHCRFLGDDGTQLPVFPKILRRERVRESKPWSKHLGHPDSGYLRIDRSIEINGEFSVFSKFFADAGRFGALMLRPLKQLESANFKRILAREFRIPSLRFSQSMQVLLFPRAVSLALELPAHTTGAMLSISASAPDGTPVYFQQLYIPPNPRQWVVGDDGGRDTAAPLKVRTSK